ncbi:MAG: heavy-metal-associated domain-containing protein [Chloroflexi bacterium]|nr:heavy-metal-associated domain-containing protein [Chloroflexota bacterium]
MTQATISVPAMYGDHHVLEVRRILLALPGVQDVEASSAFHVVEVTYDPEKLSEDDIQAALGEYGYLDELPTPTETGVAVTESDGQDTYFRYTAAYAQTKEMVGFEQRVTPSVRPLWSCPGMGVIKPTDET